MTQSTPRRPCRSAPCTKGGARVWIAPLLVAVGLAPAPLAAQALPGAQPPALAPGLSQELERYSSERLTERPAVEWLWSSLEAPGVAMCLPQDAYADTPWAPAPQDAALLAQLDPAEAHPLIADRIELAQVEETLARWSAGDVPSGEAARETTLCALEVALASPSSAVAARARVARARCLFLVDDPAASENLEALLRRYPELPDEVPLRLEEARAHARASRAEAAAVAFRAIDLRYPGTTEGRLARDGLAALEASGHVVPALTAREQVERAARLVRSGPPDLARTTLTQLRAVELPALLAAEVFVLSSRLARVEGRFDEADAFTAQARTLDPRLAVGAPAPLARPATDEVGRVLRVAGLAPLLDGAASEAQRARALRRVSSARLLELTRTASRGSLREVTSALVTEASRRAQLACSVRFEIAVVASGTASDESIVAIADRCVDDAGHGVRARYLRGRALERLGRLDAARTDYTEVRDADRSDTGFYALWAAQRLAALDVQVPAAVVVAAEAPVTLAATAELAALPASEPAAPDAAVRETAVRETAVRETVERAPIDVAASLAELADRHGEAYPWLARARELVVLGDAGAAREELHELYLAWLDARGRGPIRAGVEAVYRGATRQPLIVPASLRRQRRELNGQDAARLGRVAEALGDVGLSIRFGGPTRASDRPRAFETLVVGAAARHAIDPNLLLAVMRVESVYDPEIVSYAGAIGLLQIMPRTGRLIAHRLGLSDFRTDDLLDPATNIELAAWYLRSLLDRFEGRLPLAIAAYNGGPHNVRRWMEEHGADMPLDAFLERIPFDQTFRYVRRVLSHYAAYRAQEGLTLPELHTSLPPRATDVVAF